MTRREDPDWRVVAGQECRDLWVSGRGSLLLFFFGVMLSVVAYLNATNQALNFLEQRESVALTLQVAVAVGVLVTLVTCADAISGERERATLENLLLTPVPRRSIVVGKLLAALSLWGASYVVTVPYVWVLGRGVSIVVEALLVGLLVGSLLAAALAALGLLISAVSNSNKVSIAVGIFLLLALFAPTQLPTGLPQGRFGDLLGRLNPVGAGLHYITSVLVNGKSWTTDISYLVSPLLIAVLAGGALILGGSRLLRLGGGAKSR